jgi:hypothetical protein
MPHVDLYPLTASGLSAPSGCERLKSCPCLDLASVFTRTPCGFVRTKVEGQKIIMVNYLPAYLNSIFSGFGSGAHNSSDCRQEVQCCTVIPDRNAMSRHISAPPAATECSDYSASSIAAAAGEFQIALPAFDRPLQSSREGVEHSINKICMLQECKPGLTDANALSQCLPSGLLLTS